MIKNMNEEKKKIQEIGLTAIKKYLLIDPTTIDKNVLPHLLQKAKLGMQFEREMNITQRTTENNQIRIFKLTTSDKRELRQLIKQHLPTYA